jgi:SAM-dependent methyltransferase
LSDIDPVLRQVNGLVRQSRFPEAIVLLEDLRRAQTEEDPKVLEPLIDLYEITGQAEKAEACFEPPVPPRDLRARVGVPHAASYHEGGHKSIVDLAAALPDGAESLASYRHIYDFGCGAGRQVRWLPKFAPEATLYGSDIDTESIRWCEEKMGFAQWRVNELTPPLPYSEAQFDLVYSLSVFTHLNEDMQFRWLEELQRVTQPGGVLLLTIHGQKRFEEMAERDSREIPKETLDEQGFAFGPYADHREDLYGEDSGVTFHAHHYVREKWADFFTIESIISLGLANWQDIVVARR